MKTSCSLDTHGIKTGAKTGNRKCNYYCQEPGSSNKIQQHLMVSFLTGVRTRAKNGFMSKTWTDLAGGWMHCCSISMRMSPLPSCMQKRSASSSCRFHSSRACRVSSLYNTNPESELDTAHFHGKTWLRPSCCITGIVLFKRLHQWIRIVKSIAQKRKP